MAQILAFIDTGITNARTEATDRMVKDAARISSDSATSRTSGAGYGCSAKRTIISQPMRR